MSKLIEAAFPEKSGVVDLHGLKVKDALSLVEIAIGEARASGQTELRIICGKGRHSKGGVGVLRQAVPGWLEANGYRFTRQVEADGLDGAIILDLDSAGG